MCRIYLTNQLLKIDVLIYFFDQNMTQNFHHVAAEKSVPILVLIFDYELNFLKYDFFRLNLYEINFGLFKE